MGNPALAITLAGAAAADIFGLIKFQFDCEQTVATEQLSCVNFVAFEWANVD